MVCALAGAGISVAQGAFQSSAPASNKRNHTHAARHRTLNKNDRSSVIAVALRARKARVLGRDCSHLVHAIYERAGFPYPYADSEDLYDGAERFRRVSHPEPADLIVWHGHVGIVVRPSGHKFFSFLRTGPGLDDYRSRYWRSRGEPRFYRYVKSDS